PRAGLTGKPRPRPSSRPDHEKRLADPDYAGERKQRPRAPGACLAPEARLLQALGNSNTLKCRSGLLVLWQRNRQGLNGGCGDDDQLGSGLQHNRGALDEFLQPALDAGAAPEVSDCPICERLFSMPGY